MKQRCKKWIINLIEFWDEPFTAVHVRERLVDKHGTNCVPCSVSIANFLKRNCDVIGMHDGRNLYSRRKRR